MKTILVPTDFSEAADHAADLAARLAAKHGAEIHLIHSVDVPDTWQDGRFTNAAMAKKTMREQRALYPEVQERVGQARQNLESLSARLARKKVKVHYEIAANAAWEDVVRLARLRKADLVVMGTRGAGALKEAFLGSNTQKVVRLATMPVLTLRAPAPYPMANIAVLIDPLEPGLEKMLPKLLAPFTGQRTRVHLVNVNTPVGNAACLGQATRTYRCHPYMRSLLSARRCFGLCRARRHGLDSTSHPRKKRA